ncbi:MAG TPA: hypothetical protein VMD28_08670, partial [Acidimicrobiales bacterium]|nr:hypothetical protein [Acidimicrobiales bacterium]
LRNAKVVGRFAVDFGLRQLKGQLESLGGARPTGAESPPGEGRAQPRSDRPKGTHPPVQRPERAGRGGAGPRERHREPGREAPAVRPRTTVPPGDSEVDRAIPDYDVLAASQVVRRLDGLGREELEAVVRHERATRARRTIVHRAEQLLGDRPRAQAARAPDPTGAPSGAPGSPGPPGRSRTSRTPRTDTPD